MILLKDGIYKELITMKLKYIWILKVFNNYEIKISHMLIDYKIQWL